MSGNRSDVRRTQANMAAIKIGAMDVTPVVPQTGSVSQAARDAARRQVAALRPKSYNPYASYREESITCRETTAGTYEAVLGSDLVVHDQGGRKGQLVDFWI